MTNNRAFGPSSVYDPRKSAANPVYPVHPVKRISFFLLRALRAFRGYNTNLADPILKQKAGLETQATLSGRDYHRVKTAMLKPDGREIGLELRLFAFIAKNGGWLGRRTDPIGPTILMRGMLHVPAVIDAATRYGALMQELLENPQVLRKLLCV